MAKLVKRTGRFFIEDEDGNIIYSPPEFLRPYIHGRLRLNELAEAISNNGDPIKLIVEFESRVRPCTIRCTK